MFYCFNSAKRHNFSLDQGFTQLGDKKFSRFFYVSQNCCLYFSTTRACLTIGGLRLILKAFFILATVALIPFCVASRPGGSISEVLEFYDAVPLIGIGLDEFVFVVDRNFECRDLIITH